MRAAEAIKMPKAFTPYRQHLRAAGTHAGQEQGPGEGRGENGHARENPLIRPGKGQAVCRLHPRLICRLKETLIAPSRLSGGKSARVRGLGQHLSVFTLLFY